jgi:hypothetical protein
VLLDSKKGDGSEKTGEIVIIVVVGGELLLLLLLFESSSGCGSDSEYDGDDERCGVRLSLIDELYLHTHY